MSQGKPNNKPGKLKVIIKKNDEFELLDSRGIGGRAVSIDLWHCGITALSAGTGTAKLSSSKWVVDLAYC